MEKVNGKGVKEEFDVIDTSIFLQSLTFCLSPSSFLIKFCTIVQHVFHRRLNVKRRRKKDL